MTQRISSQHPLLKQEYAIYTPPIHQFAETIGNWIDQRITGGHIYGPSRFGKSRAIKWHLKSVLADRFRISVPLVMWIRQDSQISEAEFWNSLLWASHYEFCDPEKPKTKLAARFLVEQQFLTLSRRARRNYIVLLIDEAQAMPLKEWTWLLGLQNTLDYQGIRFSVISIGSYTLHYQPDYLARTGNAHIAARFYAQDAAFHGITEDNLEYVLNGYDINSVWPKNSGISYTHYFAEDDFSRGRRLTESAPLLWDAFVQLLPKGWIFKKDTPLEIPMEHLAHTVENALRRLGAGESWDTVTSKDGWVTMIGQTGFTDFMRNIR